MTIQKCQILLPHQISEANLRFAILLVITSYPISEGKILFNCPTDETVYDCLSCHIDYFELILNNKVSISSIANRAREKNCELNSNQTILMFHCMQYLKFSYLFMLEKNLTGKEFNI